MATRRIAAVTALVMGLVLALAAASSHAATRALDTCLLDCTTATTTTTATNTSTTSTSATTTTATTATTTNPLATIVQAAAGLVSVSSLTSTSAVFAAAFRTGSDATDLRFQVFSGATPVLASPWVSLPAGAPAAPVSYTATGLAPDETYAVRLVWFDAAAGVDIPVTGALSSFETPLQAAAVPALAASATQIWIGQSVTLTGAAASNPLGSLADLQASTPPAGSFSQYLDTSGAPVLGIIGAGIGATSTFTESPLRNVQFRLSLPGTMWNAGGHPIQQPSVSTPVSVDVFPVGSVVTSRPKNTATVLARANFGVHALPAGYRGEYVYFYNAPNSSSTGELIGRDRLVRSSPNVDGITRLSAHISFTQAKSAYVHACVQHAILPDMGTPFTDASCGRRTLRPASH